MKRLFLIFALLASVAPGLSQVFYQGRHAGNGYGLTNLNEKPFTNNLYIPGSQVVSNNSTATNFSLLKPQWVDQLVNFSFSTIGPSAPALTPVGPGSVIQGLAFDNGDMLYAQCQLPHNLAITNDNFPVFFMSPHIHFSTIGTLDATHSNVTWRVEWELANINQAFTNRGTNQATMGVTNNFTQYILDLGDITSNPPLNISAMFRCRLMRPASLIREYSPNAVTHDVILDGFDIHVPVGNSTITGSRDEYTQ